ncbi:MAG: hypothetical protein M3O31_03595 [Acidobacteriota bacterium]|nr:hypothetical protein [Acidobacteriota bacterium]
MQLSAAGIFGARLGLPSPLAAQVGALPPGARPYAELLRTWCDGLIAHQETGIADNAVRGALVCPACGIIHGRCGDAVYPLLRVARTTGEAKYVHAAVAVHDWSERQVSRADGSWVNDVTLSSWQGITVFHSIALAEALHHHGELLDAATRKRWLDRLARAAKFLDGFISIETGNINYPVTASYCFALCGQVLGEAKYTERGRALAHASVEHFTANGFLAGEGHPLNAVTAKGCRAVDLGYNVEESLPALAMYSVLTDDKAVMDQTVAALRTHMEFMLPDGAWDNSWGTRNYKWSWWGSRTSDGCHPAYVLLADHDPKFREVALRNLELMAACTHEGLLYGGPDYFEHGDLPCIHHTFTHAKALATVLDRGAAQLSVVDRVALPREEAQGLKSFPEIGTRLAAAGPWRATVTENDFEYVEQVQAGGGQGGGHATGGALTMLYHRELGPILTASMTEYKLIEISNQQVIRSGPHMALTPRIELVTAGPPSATHTSLSDLEAIVTATDAGGEIAFEARGRLLSATHKPVVGGDLRYHLKYTVGAVGVDVVARVDGATTAGAVRFILPVISRSGEAVAQPDAATVRIAKAKGTVMVRTDAARGFEAVPAERTFNLVPGFECVPISVLMESGKEVRLRIETAKGTP